MKHFKLLLFIILGAAFLATSCNDDFSEEDLLNAQNAQIDSVKADNISALNEAGELVGLQLKVVNTDGAGVEGLEVSLAAALGSGGLDAQTTTTNASGVALFDRVAIGGNVIDISGGTIIPVTLDADFGSINEGTHYEIINGVVIPTPVTESAIVTVLGATTATATLQGTVQIETDLTNSAPEVPQDVTILADFDDGLSFEASFNVSYFFATNDNALNIGSAVVDGTTGVYTMLVPAGVRFDVIVPNVSASQTIAVDRVDNQDLDRPEYRDVNVNFGPDNNIFNAGFDLYNVPAIPGAIVSFNAPEAPGEGFSFGSLARVGREIPFFDFQDGDSFTEPTEDATNIVMQVINLGSGYTGTPSVAITDGGSGTGATAEAHLEWMYTSAVVTTPGDGYAADTDFSMTIDYLDGDGNNSGGVATFTVTSNGSGVIGQAEVTAGINAATGAGFDTNNWDEIADQVTGFELDFPFTGGTDGVGTATGSGRLESVFITNGGENYIDPSFTFSGGGATTQAALSVLQFGTQWSFDVDNSGVTTPYPLLPESLLFEFVEVDDDGRFTDTDDTADNQETGSNSDLEDLLTVDGSGNIQWIDQTASYETSFFADEMPVVIIVKNEAEIASATINTGDIDDLTGGITDIDNQDGGSGYTSKPIITIEPAADGAPGSGATIIATFGNLENSGEYNWFGDFEITNQGSGYLENLNQVIDERNYSFPSLSNITLREGDVRVIDIDYGTGVRAIDFN